MKILICFVALLISNLTFCQDSEVEKKNNKEKILADANNGDAEAMYQLAIKDNYPYGSRTDAEFREKWLLKAAEKSHFNSIKELGKLYYYNGPKQNGNKALVWLKKASEYDDAEAMCLLAQQYNSFFVNGERDAIDNAIFYFTKSAEKGFNDAECMLYAIYVDNQYGKKNKKLAEYWKSKCQ